MQNDAPKSFNFSGIISEMTKNGRDKTAQLAMKITNEKLTIGIQLTISTSYPHVFNIMYKPNEINPVAIPMVEATNKN